MADEGMTRRGLRGRGQATRKFRRASATGKAQAERVAFGHTWGAINARLAQQLRAERK